MKVTIREGTKSKPTLKDVEKGGYFVSYTGVLYKKIGETFCDNVISGGRSGFSVGTLVTPVKIVEIIVEPIL